MNFKYEEIIAEMKKEREKAIVKKDEASDLYDSSTDEKAQAIFVSRMELCRKYISACDKSIEAFSKCIS